jgi:hypothetical protein
LSQTTAVVEVSDEFWQTGVFGNAAQIERFARPDDLSD